MKKILIFFLCLSLVFSQSSFVYASDTDVDEIQADTIEETEPEVEITEEKSEPTEEKTEAPKKEESKEEPKEEPKEEIIRKITASKDHISFGTISTIKSVQPQTFSITNKGNQKASIKWVQTDPENAFKLNVLNDTIINSDDTMDCQISLKEDLPQGDYSCTLCFQDAEDPSCQATIVVSAKIQKKESSPKEENSPKPIPEEKPAKKENKKPEKKQETVSRYTIRTHAEPAKAGSTSGDGEYAKGDSAVLTATTKEGYLFKGWYFKKKKISSNETYIVKDVKQNADYTAIYSHKDFKITTKSANKKYGQVSGGGFFEKGDIVTIKATPKKGYYFVGWYEKDKLVSNEANYQFEAKRNRNIKGVFHSEKNKVKISVYPKEAGTVKGEGEYKDYEEFTISAKAKDGYVFKGFLLNNQLVTIADSYTVKNIDRDLSFTAYFEKVNAHSYTITAGVASDGGIISPAGELSIGEHGSMTYTISPKDGYAISALHVDGKKVETQSTYTFENITENHKIVVAFAPKKNNVNHVDPTEIIPLDETSKRSVSQLFPATSTSEGRSSNIITPDLYVKMRTEGTLEDLLQNRARTFLGMDEKNAPETVDEYNYDEAIGLYQVMDITPDQAVTMIEKNQDDELLRTAYEEGYLDLIVNNQFLAPGKEEEANSVFEDKRTIKNILEFVSGILSKEEKMDLTSGQNMTISFAVTHGQDMMDSDKKDLEKSGAKINECFYITVMKQIGENPSELVTELKQPVEIVLKNQEDSNCIVRSHNGKAEILDDLDDKEETITIRTDKFSPYAFAKKEKNYTYLFLLCGGCLFLVCFAGLLCFIKKRD